MKITIEFDTDNAAFEDVPFAVEVKAVLSKVTEIINWGGQEPGDSSPLRDSYGNTIGEVRFS